jgi:YD repeat-containing protein
MTRMRSEEPLPLGELVIALADSDTRDGLDHVIATLLRDETVMSYSYDEIGRLRTVRSVRRQYSVDPLTELRVAAAVDSTTDAGSKAFFLELGAEATRRGPSNQPLDGDFIDVIESDVWRTTTTLEMRVESWDARGRWTRAVTYAQDEAGEIAAYESERRFTDLSLSAEPVHGEFQFMPRSATPGLGRISSLEPEFKKLAQARGKPAAPHPTQGDDAVASAAPPPVSQEEARAQLPSEAVATHRAEGSAPHAQPAEAQPPSSLVGFTAVLLAALGAAVLLLLMAIRAGLRSKK